MLFSDQLGRMRQIDLVKIYLLDIKSWELADERSSRTETVALTVVHTRCCVAFGWFGALGGTTEKVSPFLLWGVDCASRNL